MTFTEKMIATGLLTLSTVIGFCCLTRKNGESSFHWLVEFTGILAFLEVVLFTNIWIWSQ